MPALGNGGRRCNGKAGDPVPKHATERGEHACEPHPAFGFEVSAGGGERPRALDVARSRRQVQRRQRVLVPRGGVAAL